MIDAPQVGPALDERLDGLTSVPPEHYLVAGRAARGRRRLRRAGGVAAVVVVGLLVATQGLPRVGDDPVTAREREPRVAASATTDADSLSTLSVEPGLGRIDSFSTDEIPEWAKEYGNHGPADISPEGRLWIAPETTVVRSIADPFGAEGEAAGVAHSYALEVRWTSADGTIGEDELVWWFGYQDAGETYTLGTTDDADRWTSDFALWAENETSSRLDKPSFDQRLVAFEDDRSTTLVPLPGVEIVRQTTDVDTGDREQFARRSVAEVRVGDQTYFVLANGRLGGHAFYEPFQAGVVAPDLAGFLDYVAADSNPADDTP